MNDDFDDQGFDMMQLMGIGDAMFMMQDEDGFFDKRKEPARALAVLEDAIQHQSMTTGVLEMALVQLMTDGQKIVVHLPQPYGVVAVLRHEDHLYLMNAEDDDEPAENLADAHNGTYSQKVADLQTQIYTDEYYVSLYQNALREHKMTNAGIEKHEYGQTALNNMLNDFWFSLPDSQAIRTGPFFFLCDLCEQGPGV